MLQLLDLYRVKKQAELEDELLRKQKNRLWPILSNYVSTTAENDTDHVSIYPGDRPADQGTNFGL
jgi:hypothetical protein